MSARGDSYLCSSGGECVHKDLVPLNRWDFDVFQLNSFTGEAAKLFIVFIIAVLCLSSSSSLAGERGGVGGVRLVFFFCLPFSCFLSGGKSGIVSACLSFYLMLSLFSSECFSSLCPPSSLSLSCV